MPLAPRATHITGVDSSRAMLDQFAAAAERARIGHREIEGRWPDVAIEAEAAGRPIEPVDVVVCHHVFYNVPDLEPFVVALTAVARLGVVVVLPKRHPMSAWNSAWKHFWNLDRPEGPTSDDAIAVLRALGIEPEVIEVPRPAMARQADDPTALVTSARRRLSVGGHSDDFLDESGQFGGVAIDIGENLSTHRCVHVGMSPHHVEIRAQAGERRAQFVSRVLDQTLLQFLRTSERGQHLGERSTETPGLVSSRH